MHLHSGISENFVYWEIIKDRFQEESTHEFKYMKNIKR